MKKSKCIITIWASETLRERVDQAAALQGMSRSQYARAAIEATLDGHSPDIFENILRRVTFAEIGIDALLSGHQDEELRTRAHNAFNNRVQRRQAREPGQ